MGFTTCRLLPASRHWGASVSGGGGLGGFARSVTGSALPTWRRIRDCAAALAWRAAFLENERHVGRTRRLHARRDGRRPLVEAAVRSTNHLLRSTSSDSSPPTAALMTLFVFARMVAIIHVLCSLWLRTATCSNSSNCGSGFSRLSRTRAMGSKQQMRRRTSCTLVVYSLKQHRPLLGKQRARSLP